MYQCSQNSHNSVQAAFDSVTLVGSELRTHLNREIKAKVLLRRARDVLLLSGPIGSGKEKVSAAIHEAARRDLQREGELVEVNCANLGGGRFEIELFGYRRGAFAHADRDHGGLIGRAAGGTIVLDDVQALGPEDQARLLRLLGEREYRPLGDSGLLQTDALIILASNQNLDALVERGELRRDLLDRALAKIVVPPLFERRKDIAQLVQAFADEAAQELQVRSFHGFTRRALADIEVAIVRAHEVSVRRLRQLVRECVFLAAADLMPEAIESEHVLPLLETELGFATRHRDEQDRAEIMAEFDLLVGRSRLEQIAVEHNVSLRTLLSLSNAVRVLIDEMDDKPRSYRNVVERTNRLAKVALWLVSGARSQAEFRRYFGSLDADKPTKSVAHQIYHEVFRTKGGAS